MLLRLAVTHTAGAGLFIGVWQTAIALPPGPTDVRLVLAGLAIPTLAAVGSGFAIATAEHRREQAAPMPAQRPAIAHTAPKELTAR
ncbi:hypothetical protein ACFUYE_30165 [Micromonospora humida]|uniref:hypothetical protein n=1 Tax=Micromonospora humida TaxID=2809018 RepID=UPI00366B916B